LGNLLCADTRAILPGAKGHDMNQFFRAVAVALACCSAAGSAQAGMIERACLEADRRDASHALCGCIQRVADAMLSPEDQRRGAAFFVDPAASQDVRASSRRSDELFWERWTEFGEAAERYCD
jgi:hypothetical protein